MAKNGKNGRSAGGKQGPDGGSAGDQGAGPGLRLVYMPAGELRTNPKNWRTHPPAQVDALRKVIADPEIGFVSPFLVNESSGLLIDGHARLKAVSADTVVPVLVGRWSVRGEAKVLATLDRIGQMAERDDAAVAALLAEVGDGLPDEIRRLMELELSPNLGADDEEPEPVDVPESYQVVVECKGEREQRQVFERLKDQGLKVRVVTL